MAELQNPQLSLKLLDCPSTPGLYNIGLNDTAYSTGTSAYKMLPKYPASLIVFADAWYWIFDVDNF